MPDINLLKGHKLPQGFQTVRRIPQGTGKVTLIVLLILVVLELGLYGMLRVNKNNVVLDTAQKEQEISQLKSSIESQADEINEAVAGQFTAQTFAELFEKHIYWTKVLEEMGKVTLKTVSFQNLQGGSEEAEFIVSGTAASFSEVGKFLLGFETSKNFETVELLSTEPDQVAGFVQFEVKVQMDKNLLLDYDEDIKPITP